MNFKTILVNLNYESRVPRSRCCRRGAGTSG